MPEVPRPGRRGRAGRAGPVQHRRGGPGRLPHRVAVAAEQGDQGGVSLAAGDDPRGQQFTGIKVRETPTTLVLRTDQDKEIAIPVKSIEERVREQELADARGADRHADARRDCSTWCASCRSWARSDRWSISRARLARRWEVLQPNRPAFDLYFSKGVGSLAGNPPELVWEPAYATVAGMLPVAELARLRPGKTVPSAGDRRDAHRGDRREQGRAQGQRRQGADGLARRRDGGAGRQDDSEPEAGRPSADAVDQRR